MWLNSVFYGCECVIPSGPSQLISCCSRGYGKFRGVTWSLCPGEMHWPWAADEPCSPGPSGGPECINKTNRTTNWSLLTSHSLSPCFPFKHLFWTLVLGTWKQTGCWMSWTWNCFRKRLSWLQKSRMSGMLYRTMANLSRPRPKAQPTLFPAPAAKKTKRKQVHTGANIPTHRDNLGEQWWEVGSCVLVHQLHTD